MLLFRWQNKIRRFWYWYLTDGKSQKNILIYDVSYKTLIGPKPLHNRFNKIDGFIRIYNGSRYLTLFGSKKCDAIYIRIRYLKSEESKKSKNSKKVTSHVFSLYNAIIKVDFYDSLPVEKTLTLHNVTILLVLNKDKNHYYYKTFWEKCLYRLAKKIIKNIYNTNIKQILPASIFRQLHL